MKALFYALLSVFLICQSLPLAAQKIRVEKEPSWVTKDMIDYSSTALDKDAKDGSVDLAFEKQVSVEQQCSYYKKAIRIISEAGIQNSSQISRSYDPSYEQLIFHSIKIIRDGKEINKLEPSKFKLIQQETELSRSIYNGSLSAVLFLEDVRKGDVIEYSYSIKGFNPIFKGKFAENFDAGFAVPVYKLYYKLITPSNRNFTIKNSLANVEPVVTKTPSKNIYEWKLTNVKAVHEEDKTPSWYDPYPMIMVSEYSNWKEVNDWAVSLFPKNVSLSPGLKQKIEEIRSHGTTDEERILAALRFVQDDVRYMGIEMGENSHKPNNPNKIFSQRFGDCKDKSYLLCTILQALDLEAHPVLINTGYKKTIQSWLPSPFAFDHTTVQVNLAGQIYYFDATISYQRGRMNDISFPDYQTGLVLTDTTTSLANIPLQENGMVKTKEVFTIPDMNGKVKLTVITEYTGSYADDMRDEFKNNSMYDMQKSFQDFYAGYYEEASAVDSLEIQDDENDGTFTITEHYLVDNFWDDKDKIKQASFYAFLINSVLHKPKDVSRKMPFAINYPAHYIEDVEINLPENWDAEKSVNSLKCAAFNLNARFDYFRKKIVLHYEYEALKDFVTPQETKDFLSAYSKFEDKFGYELTYNSSDGRISDDIAINTKASFPPVLIFFLVAGFVVAVVWWTRKSRT